MKIFLNNFCLVIGDSFTFSEFSFEEKSLAEVSKKLVQRQLDFDGQVFHVQADESSGFVSQIFDLQTTPGLGDLRAELVLRFDSENAQQKFLESYKSRFQVVPAAGGVVRNELDEILLIEREGKWDLPKGKVEKGESNEEAAVREVEEETGVTHLVPGKQLPTTWHVFYRKRWKLKPTYWWNMQLSGTQLLVPQSEEGITQVVWRPASELRIALPDTYPTIVNTLRAAIFPSAI